MRMIRLGIRISLGYRSVIARFLLCGALHMHAQAIPAGPVYAPAGTIPAVNVGGSYMEAQFARVEFAEKLLDEQNRQEAESNKLKKRLLDSGTVSVLDLNAPRKALTEFNTASELLKQQKDKEAIAHLQKAIASYPNFVSAHNDLGIAYQNLERTEEAKGEFETAAKLDQKFAQSFMNLGKLSLSQKDFSAAESNLERAASLRPADAKLLTVLAYAQHGGHHYH